MEITKLEKAALITTGAAAAYKTLLWNVGASVTSTELYIIALQWLFAFVSFAAFDLVLMAVIARGWSWHAAFALGVASLASGAIGLEVGKVVIWPGLHAAPAVTLAAFGLHLMLCPQVAPAPASTVNNTQINVGAPLPPNVASYIAAKAAEHPEMLPDELAALIGVGARSVRNVLQLPEQEVTS